METIINVDDVSFSYGTQTEQALSHISLGVNKGLPVGCRAPPLHRHVLWVRHG